MAWYWRWRTRQWRWRPRRRFTRRRRGLYNRRTYRFGRYRGRVRRRRLRRRRRRRRAPIASKVIVWNPERVVKCRIIGWHFGLFCNSLNSMLCTYVPTVEKKRPILGLHGGGVTLIPFTLESFYRDFLYRRAFWTRSNEGFDLGMYLGTRFTFFPHWQYPYIVTWLRDFSTPQPHHIRDMHPAISLFQANKKVILPRSFGRKKKFSLWLRPPPLNERKWYTIQSWCNVVLAKIGITFINITSPLLHKDTPYPACFAGWSNTSGNFEHRPLWDSQIGNPQTLGNKPEHLATYNVPIMYRPHWDDGKGNYLLVNTGHTPPNIGGMWSPSGGNRVPILSSLAIDMPYWQWFYGCTEISGVFQTTRTEMGPIYWPNVVGILWYADVGTYLPGQTKLTPDYRTYAPEQLPGTKDNRVWVILSHDPPALWGDFDSTRPATADKWPNLLTIEEIGSKISGTAGFALGPGEMPTATASIPFFYKSYWKWGGTFADAEIHVRDPCSDHPMATSTDRFGVQIRDPATVSLANIHPWDLEHGAISKPAMLRLLSSIFDPGSLQPAQPLQPAEHPKAKEGDEEGSPEQSSSDGDSDTPCSEETSSEEETAVWKRKLQRMAKRVRRERQFRRRVKQRLEDLRSSGPSYASYTH
ncbi:ORF1 [Seal anellovirus 5]|uniref:Capsid protein n=1 Tax=Seal anellovirus 5 TaxID=1566010 RepID=A0A0A7U2I7_9VIRU|nr:ORF1 [Seal anellovirus 5]AJA71663.1 ORF1 [Seal anellovirus 5]